MAVQVNRKNDMSFEIRGKETIWMKEMYTDQAI